jgi:hypothetical protein
MDVRVLSCGIFQPELEKILPGVRMELADCGIDVSFVAPALHVDYKKLKAGISEGLESLETRAGDAEYAKNGGREKLLLYGSMCHPDIAQIAGEHAAIYPSQGNCIDMFLSPEEKKRIEGGDNVFFMTGGWFKYWRDIFQQGQGWDSIDARINFGRYDKILVLDSGSHDISEEELFEFFDYIQVPIDIEPITLDYFRKLVADICRRAAGADSVI